MAHRLLLADDSLTIQKVVELTFSDSEWELQTVGNGDKAVEALSTFHPDVVLADAVMPGLSGYEVCEAVKRLPNGHTIPVVLLTGTFEPFDRARADRAGCDAIVTKPFDSHALADQVKELLKKAQSERDATPTMTIQAFAPEPEPSFAETDLDAPDALYATTALKIPTAEELERIAREEEEIKSTAFTAEPTPLFELHEPPAPEMPMPAGAPPVQASGSSEAMAFETTAPLEVAPPAKPAEDVFELGSPEDQAAPEMGEAVEEAESLDDVPALPEEPEELFDATVPTASRIEGPAAAVAPSVARADEPIIVEPIVEESAEAELVPEVVPELGAEPLAAEPSAPGPFVESSISVEPIVDEEPFEAPPIELPEDLPVPPPAPAAAPVELGSGADPEQGDIVAAIAAYERSYDEEPPLAAVAPAPEPPSAEVSELEALAAGAKLDDLKRLIPSAAEGTSAGALSPEQVDAIARRVVELLGEKVVREVAWEIVPEMAERLVRARLQELEGA